MNENLNLCEILKGHEGEIFYSPIYGDVRLISIKETFNIYPIVTVNINNESCTFTNLGKYRNYENGECLLFPSKEQRDWNKWFEEQNPKVPKTWSEYIHSISFDNISNRLSIDLKQRDFYGITNQDTPIEKSALALLKIHQLIEVSYGGYPTKKDYDNANYERLWTVRIYKTDDNDFIFGATPLDGECFKNNIAFHTIEQANEFISYPENIQLLKDYFMINK